jgi:plastocyanin
VLARLSILLTIALACGVLAAQAWAASTRGVGLHDNYITFTSASAPHGTITFNVRNHGLNTHTFNIKRISTGNVLYQSARIGPGTTLSVTKTLKAGTYRIYCTIHAGMHKIFTVT